jgi:hypothetical protein
LFFKLLFSVLFFCFYSFAFALAGLCFLIFSFFTGPCPALIISGLCPVFARHCEGSEAIRKIIKQSHFKTCLDVV